MVFYSIYIFISLVCFFSLDRSSVVYWHSDFPRSYINQPRVILALRMKVIMCVGWGGEEAREREREDGMNMHDWETMN